MRKHTYMSPGAISLKYYILPQQILQQQLPAFYGMKVGNFLYQHLSSCSENVCEPSDFLPVS